MRHIVPKTRNDAQITHMHDVSLSAPAIRQFWFAAGHLLNLTYTRMPTDGKVPFVILQGSQFWQDVSMTGLTKWFCSNQ